MAQTFDDLDRYFDPGLTLTVNGREYAVPLPSAELGVWCRRVAQAAGEIHAASTDEEMQAAVDRVNALTELPGGKNVTLHERVLGELHAQMAADKVSDPHIQFCGATAYVWIIGGEEAARRYWYSGGNPEALRPTPANRTERRAQARAGKTSTAAGAATRKRASTSGTRSPKKSPGSTPAKASRGKKS